MSYSCAGSHIYLWDVNGRAVASVDTVAGPGAGEVQVLCVAQSQWAEWDRQNVLMTGSSDGVVRMWSLDYVEVPVGAAADASPAAPSPEPKSEVSTMTRLAKKMSVSLSGDCLTSFREAVARQKQDGASLHSELGDLSLADSSDTEDCEDLEVDAPTAASSPLDIEPSVLGSPRPPLSPTSPLRSVAEETPDTQATSTEDKVATNSADDSFVVIEAGQVEEGVEVVEGPAMRPGDGYTWSRQVRTDSRRAICP